MDSYSEGAQGRGLYMWLLFVRNGGCGRGREEKEGSQRSAVEMQSLWPTYIHLYVCMFFSREGESVYFVCGKVSVSLRVCVSAALQGQGKRAKGEGHNALGEGDEICGVRW